MHDQRDGAGRAVWLRERLAELARNLGRVPNRSELSSFIIRYKVDLTEVDALVDDGDAKKSSRTRTSAAPPRPRAAVIPEARRPVEATTARPVSPLASPPASKPASSLSPLDIECLPKPDGDRTRDKVVRRAVDDLVDDWYRGGRELHYEDVSRLTAKRGLSAEQTAEILEELGDQGVEVVGLRTVRRLDEEGAECVRSKWGPSEAVSDLVRAYLLKIGKYPLIWADDEVRLGRQIRLGLDADAVLEDKGRRSALSAARLASLRDASAAGRRAHSEMVCANLRLVVSIAKRWSYEGCGVEFIDRVQDGNTGLMHAADKFDPTLGYKFSTYATWWIRQAITRGIADRGRLIRIPVHVHEKLGKMRGVRRDLAARLGREPTTTELSDVLEWPAATVQAMIDYSRPIASLDVLVGTEGDTTLGDLLSDQADIDGRTDPINCVLESALVRGLDVALASLPDRSAEVIRRRYGLYGGDDQTLEEIGLRFGLTRERIRQIESKAMSQLRSPETMASLRSYLIESDTESPPTRTRPVRQRSMSTVTGFSQAATSPLSQESAFRRAQIERDQVLYPTIAEIVDIA